MGLAKEGMKEILGMWVGKSEFASFWKGVLTDLKARGVEDILITVTDNLNGKIRKYIENKLSFPGDEALKKSIYLCIVEIEKRWTQPVWNWGWYLINFWLSLDRD
ncbi:hypothetical protein EZS27_019788 [termite gut metagenome]|uniref:Mutator family transposase n=1 Tax=termite gut metagenome TaxID=433724 RepID=A0A5J4RD64_9ZZZZ